MHNAIFKSGKKWFGTFTASQNFNFTASSNKPLSPIKHLKFDRINNWINELKSTNEENNIEDCKWTVDLEFKPFQHDFSILGKLLYTLGFWCGVYIITSIGISGFFGGFLGAIFGNGFDDNRVTEGYGISE